jgi:hypothetical protein
MPQLAPSASPLLPLRACFFLSVTLKDPRDQTQGQGGPLTNTPHQSFNVCDPLADAPPCAACQSPHRPGPPRRPFTSAPHAPDIKIQAKHSRDALLRLCAEAQRAHHLAPSLSSRRSGCADPAAVRRPRRQGRPGGRRLRGPRGGRPAGQRRAVGGQAAPRRLARLAHRRGKGMEPGRDGVSGLSCVCWRGDKSVISD